MNEKLLIAFVLLVAVECCLLFYWMNALYQCSKGCSGFSVCIVYPGYIATFLSLGRD